jgi:5-methylcytosine-specific restriction enzyme A
MPYAPKKPCAEPGCYRLVESSERRCPEHAAQAKERLRDYERLRSRLRRAATGSVSGFYSSMLWKHPRTGLRAIQLRREPLCCDPYQVHGGRPVAGSVADHKIDHHNDPSVFFDANNLQTLCTYCHGLKSVRESGGFGRKPLTPRGTNE